MEKFLITGGAGFIGSHLVEALLKKGKSVIVLDNFDVFYSYKTKIKNLLESLKIKDFNWSHDKNTDIENLSEISKSSSFELIFGDIRDADLLQQIFDQHSIDCVVHLAALAGVRPSIENPVAYEQVNIAGTLLLWENCKKHGIHKFVCASSSSVYGNNTKVPFAETDVVDFAISPYAATKKAGEVMGHVYHSLYNIDMVQLRFFTVYGPRQRPDLAIHKFTKLIDAGEDIPFFGDGSTARDYTYIEDIIDGVIKSILFLENNHHVYEIINLGESEVITLSQMVQTIENTLDKKALIKQLPMQPGDVNKTNADISKAKALLGYAPKTNFENGIRKFVEWYRKNGVLS